ncbi:MAG: hypothetical protein WEC75_06920 [Dehalococcoidia bacterium]
MRIIAVDWSGAKAGAQRKIWLAEAAGGILRRLECGRSREEISQHLVDLAARDGELMVGLDFAFSFPAWFLRSEGFSSAHELWRACAGGAAERWLSACDPPFWGRPGRGRPDDVEHFRRTERETTRVAGIGPKSVFQVGGAGAVGTGSLRGMPALASLRDAGFAVWPFDSPRLPLVMEIYPRVLTGHVAKSREDARRLHLTRYRPQLGALFETAASSQDAFDAATSAIVMSQHARSFASLAGARDEVERLEGAIWSP